MALKPVYKVARIATIGLTVAGAAFGSVTGLAASGWEGVFVIVPISAALFAIVGALLGAAIEFAIRLKHPRLPTLTYGCFPPRPVIARFDPLGRPITEHDQV